MIFRSYILFIGFMCAALLSFGQRGPGGVSDDSNDQKNCRLWLDTKDLTSLSDGDSVLVWYDKSISAPDSAFRDPLMAHKYNPPVFRNTPSAGINGHPVISFENGGMLGIGRWPLGEASPDLNSNPGMITTYEQTTFLAFRTSNNVSDRQILWEEGGAERGMTIYIYQDSVYIGAFDVKEGDNDYYLDISAVPGRNKSVPKFGFTYKTLPIQVNTTYVLCYKYDVRKDNHLITNDPATLVSKTGQIHTGLTGTINGQAFPTEMKRGKNYANSESTYRCETCPVAVGGIYIHEDPVGIGGMNQGGFNEYSWMHGGNDSNPELNWTKINTPVITNSPDA